MAAKRGDQASEVRLPTRSESTSTGRVERLRVLGRRPIAVGTVASVPGIEVVFQFGPRAGVTVRAASDRP